MAKLPIIKSMKKVDKKELIEALEGACKSFAFILPEPITDKNMCKTNTELYRVQHKLAKQVWVDALKKLNQYKSEKNK